MTSLEKSLEFEGQHYFADPHSIAGLPPNLNKGLIAIGACGLLSFIATLSLLSFVAYRFITWKNHYKTFIGHNQYVLLFLNLVLADFLQAASFLVSFYWVAKDAILAPTPGCSAQGFLLNLGDVASAFFVLAIAIHTYWTAVAGKHMRTRTFACIVASLWLAATFLTVVGLGIHGDSYYVRAGAWCWISNSYEPERLGLHYFWFFLSQFGLIVLYLCTFSQLRHRTRSLFGRSSNNAHIPAPNQRSIDVVNRITTLMMLYPLVYVILTLPLSSVRMWSMARDGKGPSDITNAITGVLLASCGWVDCLLYTLTRERLLDQTMGGGGESSSHNKLSRASRSDATSSNNGAILRTTAWTVRNEDGQDLQGSADGVETEVYSDGTSGHSSEKGSGVKHYAELAVRERSPSPTGSEDAIVARQRERGRDIRMVVSPTHAKGF